MTYVSHNVCLFRAHDRRVVVACRNHYSMEKLIMFDMVFEAYTSGVLPQKSF
jgi:hypothetical protein